jgi:hypothetical protein
MNSRARLISTMNGKGDEYEVPKVELGYWVGTIRNWSKEGLPIKKKIPDTLKNANAFFTAAAIDTVFEEERLGMFNDVNVKEFFKLDHDTAYFPIDFSALLPEEIIEKNDTHIISRDSYGSIIKNNINMDSIPMEVDSPVKDWQSWGNYKQYYSVDTIEKRLPENWDDITRALKYRDFPVKLGRWYAGFLGFPRKIMGLTNYLLALYDNPGLVHDICDTLLELLIALYSRIAKDIDIDFILIWEDMSGRQGSLISPAHFREFLMPRYKKLVGFAKDIGIKNIIVDTDGYAEDLIPLYMECGITGMYPFERAARNDLLRIRKEFPDFIMIGGVDKRILFEDSNIKRIDDELDMVKEMLKYGKYIPHIDHLVSEDCKWEFFSYYRNSLNKIIDTAKFNKKLK